jgi:hypothetical protein
MARPGKIEREIPPISSWISVRARLGQLWMHGFQAAAISLFPLLR